MTSSSKSKPLEIPLKKKQTFLDKVLTNIQCDKKANYLQKKLSYSFTTKTKQLIKVNESNYRDVLLSFATKTIIKCKPLYQKIEYYLKSSKSLDQQINSAMVKISYKKASIDVMTDMKTIKKYIRQEVHRIKNPLHEIIYKIWYSHIRTKYDDKKISIWQFKQDFRNEIELFGQFIANAVYHIFGEWLYIIEKNKDVYTEIQKIFVPFLLTSGNGWRQIYAIILKQLGERVIKMKSDTKISFSYFQVDTVFMSEATKDPFKGCIKIISDFYQEPCTKTKIKQLKQLIKELRKQITQYQKQQIDNKSSNKFQEIDVDNMVGCFSYCIFASKKDGIAEALDYLEIFYRDDLADSSQYLQDIGIGHIMATLKSAALYLREKDEQRK